MSCTSCGESSCGGGSSCGSCADSCNPCNGPKTIITKQGLKGDVGDLGADGRGYDATSSTCIDVLTTGATSFGPITIEIEKAYSVGARVRFSDPANPSTNYFEGICSAYDPLTGIMTVSPIDLWVGTGTICQWDVNLAGEIGTAGAPGAPGAPGASGDAVIVEDEGNPLTINVSKMNFVGGGVTVTEPVPASNEMLITIPSPPALVGQTDYITRWISPSSIGFGIGRDDGSTASFSDGGSVAPNAAFLHNIITSVSQVASKVGNNSPGHVQASALEAVISGLSNRNIGISSTSFGAVDSNIAATFSASAGIGVGSIGTDYGVISSAVSAVNNNIAVNAEADQNNSVAGKTNTGVRVRCSSGLVNIGVQAESIDGASVSDECYGVTGLAQQGLVINIGGNFKAAAARGGVTTGLIGAANSSGNYAAADGFVHIGIESAALEGTLFPGKTVGLYVTGSSGLFVPSANDVYAIVAKADTNGTGVSYLGQFTDNRTEGAIGHVLTSIDAVGTTEWSDPNIERVGTVSSASYTLSSGEFRTIFADSTSNNVTINLPTGANLAGRVLTVVKKVAGNSVILDGSGAETINGAATKTLAAQYEKVTIQYDGTEWFIIG